MNEKPAYPTGVVPNITVREHIPTIDNTAPVTVNGWGDNTFSIKEAEDKRAHNHYFKNVAKLKYIDVYRVLSLFNVTDPCIQHAVKKLLVAGGRGAGKDVSKDIQESIDSLVRWQEMQKENV
jgi:hypothetical protein